MTKVILLTGKAQSGKDTSCDYIICKLTENGRVARKYSFADPLKEFLMKVFGCTYNQMYGSNADKDTFTKIRWENLPKLPEWYAEVSPKGLFLTARQLMQYFGTEIIRTMYESAWVQATIQKIQDESVDYAIICDCRFPNEIELLIEKFGGQTTIIRLERNHLKGRHKSEIALDKYPFDTVPSYVSINNKDITCDEKNRLVWEAVESTLKA